MTIHRCLPVSALGIATAAAGADSCWGFLSVIFPFLLAHEAVLCNGFQRLGTRQPVWLVGWEVVRPSLSVLAGSNSYIHAGAGSWVGWNRMRCCCMHWSGIRSCLLFIYLFSHCQNGLLLFTLTRAVFVVTAPPDPAGRADRMSHLLARNSKVIPDSQNNPLSLG